MVSVLLTIGALAIVGILGPLIALATETQSTYGSRLEQYIVSKQPQDVADIERYTRQYELESSKRFL
jgi:hypothetical protein